MTKPTLTSSNSLPPVPGAIDALWQPSWVHWLISVWNRRNQKTNRLAEEAQRRGEDRAREENERAEVREREIRRARIDARCHIAEI
jgi:hypothetical protein